MIKYLDFLLWHTEDIYLRIYWTTWTSTELPQNLLNYLRIYWTTWEFTELPGKLLNYLKILLNYLGNYWTTWEFYWTTSDFYWTTWVFASSNYSATWPRGSVLILMYLYSQGINSLKLSINSLTQHTNQISVKTSFWTINTLLHKSQSSLPP